MIEDKEKSAKVLEAITTLLDERLKIFLFEPLDKTTCIKIYTVIFNTITEICERSKLQLSNESANYVAQQLYDTVSINTMNENAGLDPQIFNKRAKLENINTRELIAIAGIFSGNPLVLPVVSEIKKRS